MVGLRAANALGSLSEHCPPKAILPRTGLAHPGQVAHHSAMTLGGDPPPRLSFDQETYTITLDGTPHRGIDPTAFCLVKAISDGGPAHVSSSKLRQLPGMKGKNISRELNKLPEGLRSVVKGQDGAGHRIELPP